MPHKKRKPNPTEVRKPIPKRSRNHRTATTPWETSRDEQYDVEKITAKVNARHAALCADAFPPQRLKKGIPEYLTIGKATRMRCARDLNTTPV